MVKSTCLQLRSHLTEREREREREGERERERERNMLLLLTEAYSIVNPEGFSLSSLSLLIRQQHHVQHGKRIRVDNLMTLE